jgi:hypothetical protein
MHVVSSDSLTPQRLTCSGCSHWGRAASDLCTEVEATGRCDRFGEMRPADARPRCNICWEPAATIPVAQDTALADG